MPELSPEWLGVAGFFLALAALRWRMWTYREDRRENVDVSRTYSVGVGHECGRIAIQVTNIGRTAVYIKGVALRYESNGERHEAKGGTAQEVGGTIPFTLSTGIPNPLAPGDRCTFVSGEAVVALSAHLSTLAPDKLSIDVLSGRGLLRRIRDPDIHLELVWIAKKAEERRGSKALPPGGSIFGTGM